MSSASDFVIENGVLKKYVGPGGDVVVPEGVTIIDDGAFRYCTLTSITVPEGVTRIGIRAFAQCSSLANVSIPDSVASIGNDAFEGCESITSIKIPNNIKKICHGTFQNCSNLACVIIPDGVKVIDYDAFQNCRSLSSITIPDSVTSIGQRAFQYCISLHSIEISDSVTSFGVGAFQGCKALADPDGYVVVQRVLFDYDCSNETAVIPETVAYIGPGVFSFYDDLIKVIIPESVTNIAVGAFAYCSNLQYVTVLGRSVVIGEDAFKNCGRLTEILSPNMPLAAWREQKLGIQAATGFVSHLEAYKESAIVDEYIVYLASQKKKLLPQILRDDTVEILRLLTEAKKITKKNYEADYLIPARQCQAEHCIAFLEAQFAGQDDPKLKAKADKTPNNHELWDGFHFSLDGKKLLKYDEEPGRTAYEVPEGTKEIGKEAFFMTPLEQIILPQSVTTLRNGAFTAHGGQPLYIKLPKGLKKMPAEAFWGGFFDGDDDSDGANWQKYYFVSTSNLEFIPTLCSDSYNKGCRCPIYTGGEIDDLQPREKPFAVKGFLYALQTGVEDMSRWRTGYLEHIRKNEKTYVKQAAEDDFLLHLMIDERLLSASGTKQLISAVEKKKDPERIAVLLAYLRMQFDAEDTEQDLSLSDDDSEMKRMLKMAARQGEIAGQKDIRGIAFVATGELEIFGEYNEYTGAKDMSDLKAFIEKRGGFLRSAVSSKTDYLICNDPNSDSVKSRKAKELGVPVITEQEFLRMASEKE